ncbi:hypothetical protein [Nonomuraea zeae]|uniref:Uncharacterized protein n=1 Tax=Nonomuraea zeae TaxID=1642303 RepID=A0A5S4GNT7_9ACTN|nr:hypothetical protein [Nonomuraea zeae]TMR34459.1 hypothetical protein ETD85_16665 [Nonomuraea zeae]
MTSGGRASVGALSILLFAVLIVAFAAFTVASLDVEPAAESTETAATPTGGGAVAPKTAPWTRGVDPLLPHTLVVGVDIEPGTYTSRGRAAGGNPNLQCTWARLRGLSGAGGDVIDSGAGWGQVTVTILATDKGFVTGGCAEWVGPAPPPEGPSLKE